MDKIELSDIQGNVKLADVKLSSLSLSADAVVGTINKVIDEVNSKGGRDFLPLSGGTLAGAVSSTSNINVHGLSATSLAVGTDTLGEKVTVKIETTGFTPDADAKTIHKARLSVDGSVETETAQIREEAQFGTEKIEGVDYPVVKANSEGLFVYDSAENGAAFKTSYVTISAESAAMKDGTRRESGKVVIDGVLSASGTIDGGGLMVKSSFHVLPKQEDRENGATFDNCYLGGVIQGSCGKYWAKGFRHGVGTKGFCMTGVEFVEDDQAVLRIRLSGDMTALEEKFAASPAAVWQACFPEANVLSCVVLGVDSAEDGTKSVRFKCQPYEVADRGIKKAAAMSEEQLVACWENWRDDEDDNVLFCVDDPDCGNQLVPFMYTAHVEGIASRAVGRGAHAEGSKCVAVGRYSHAEGASNVAYGHGSHAEGSGNTAADSNVHAEGYKNLVERGANSHVEGAYNFLSATYSHAEGQQCSCYGQGHHTEGYMNVVSGSYSHVEGRAVSAFGTLEHVEGDHCFASSATASHVEGGYCSALVHPTSSSLYAYSHAEGRSTMVAGEHCHSEGRKTTAQGSGSHAEGHECSAVGSYCHAEGYKTLASGTYSKACGVYSVAKGDKTFVWNGDSEILGYGSDSTSGQFRVNPVSGLSGFYVGLQSLAGILGATASVKGQLYPTLKDAIKNAVSGDTILLLNDYMDDTDALTFDVFDITGKTIDLRGHTYWNKNGAIVFCGTGGMVKDGRIVARNNGSYAMFVGDDSVETTSLSVSNVEMFGGLNVYKATGVTLQGGTRIRANSQGYAVYVDEGADVRILNGSYESDQFWYGLFCAHLGGSISIDVPKSDIGYSKFKCNGGRFANYKSGSKDLGGNIVVSGGKFDVQVPAEFVAEGSTQTEITEYGGTAHVWKIEPSSK